MPEPITILVVDDDADSRLQLALTLKTLGYEVEEASSGEEALGRMSGESPPDALIADVLMPGVGGLEMLRRYRAAGGRAPVLMISGLDKVDTVVTAMRLGATDYVTKPFNGDELREVLDRSLDLGRPRTVPATKAGMSLGHSAAMRRVSELVDNIADADVPVLITGESGVGKDVVAREIHARSARRDRVFVKINCAALPGELLESELFGHEKGSFTGAQRTKPGQFELADGGTLFLDEIGEMPVSLQAKLLQALQDGEFYRVGGQRKIRVDSRVIVATNRDLEKSIENGTFREDLYYRLNVVRIAMPSLRERREDIPELIDHFVLKYGKRYGRSKEDIPPYVVERFLQYDWPGNIRELENLVRRLMVLRDPQYVLSELRDRTPVLTPALGFPSLGSVMPAAMPAPPLVAAPPMSTGMAGMGGYAPPTYLPTPMASAMAAATETAHALVEENDFRIDLKELGRKAAHAAEREAIIAMLGNTGGNKREAAQRLGISYKAVLYKIREFGIGRPRPARRPLPAPLAPSTIVMSPVIAMPPQGGAGGALPTATANAPAGSASDGADELDDEDDDDDLVEADESSPLTAGV